MQNAARLDHDHLWHPFTQQRDWVDAEPLMITSAEGTELIDSEGRRYLDGVSSLWCNVHGHGHPAIDIAVRNQLDRVAHSTMLGLSHPGAAELAGRLVDIAPTGSTASSTRTRVNRRRGRPQDGVPVLAASGRPARPEDLVHLPRDAYHGDTIGSVSVGGMPLFHSAFGPLLFETHRAPPGDIDAMARLLAMREEEVAAVVIEPLVQGAAGMLIHPPGYLRAVRRLCDRHGVLLICDEVATGFGRTGTMFACEQEGVSPDLMCVAKGLTAATCRSPRPSPRSGSMRPSSARSPSTRPSSTATPIPATARLRRGDRLPAGLQNGSALWCGSSRRSGCCRTGSGR